MFSHAVGRALVRWHLTVRVSRLSGNFDFFRPQFRSLVASRAEKACFAVGLSVITYNLAEPVAVGAAQGDRQPVPH